MHDLQAVGMEGRGERWIGDELTWVVQFSEVGGCENEVSDGVEGTRFGMQIVAESSSEGEKVRRWLQIRRLRG